MVLTKVVKSLRISYKKTVSSIAFYPAVIAIFFLVLSWLMLELDFSDLGKHVKSRYNWVRLKDASTARAIVSTISGGIISLMVFSFSMVMILLNQAASQMSNRMLESMIGNRFQQYVLGLYIGTIVYSLFLLSTIRDNESGIYVPALSIYLLLLITVVDIFVFIYFLHYVTQSVKFEQIIERVHHQTLKTLKKSLLREAPPYITQKLPDNEPQIIFTPVSGYFQGVDKNALLKVTEKNDFLVKFLHPAGSFLLAGQSLVEIYPNRNINAKEIKDLLLTIDFYNGQPVDLNFYYGFHQLTEVALKALSPGINDPETAVLSINALADLFNHRLKLYSDHLVLNENNQIRIILCCRSFTELFTACILPIWDYGCKDSSVRNTLYLRTVQLINTNQDDEVDQFLSDFLLKVSNKIAKLL